MEYLCTETCTFGDWYCEEGQKYHFSPELTPPPEYFTPVGEPPGTVVDKPALKK